MVFIAVSQKEAHDLTQKDSKVVKAHKAAVQQNGGQPVQMPQVVSKPPVVQPVQQPAPRQQTVTPTPVVPPKKGGCGCWGKK